MSLIIILIFSAVLTVQDINAKANSNSSDTILTKVKKELKTEEQKVYLSVGAGIDFPTWYALEYGGFNFQLNVTKVLSRPLAIRGDLQYSSYQTYNDVYSKGGNLKLYAAKIDFFLLAALM